MKMTLVGAMAQKAWRCGGVGRVVRMARGYQNHVSSSALDGIDGRCESDCPRPRKPLQKVCVVGAGGAVGRVAALLLKQQPVVRVLALYEECPAAGVLAAANDLAHVDSSAALQAFQGRNFLRDAVCQADVVLVCGGCQVAAADRELFLCNMQLVRTTALAVAQFAPHAVLAVQSPPVDATWALAAHSLRASRRWAPRRLLGVGAASAMRAHQLLSAAAGLDPTAGHTPVVGGLTRCTRVPVFSAAKGSPVPQSQLDCLTRLVREADDLICKVKGCEGHLSIGFATARFVTNVMKGLFVAPTLVDSALVQQAQPDKCYGLSVCATPVTIGPHGVQEYLIPTLSPAEKALLDYSRCDLEDLLELGRCFAVGDDYYVHDCKWPSPCARPTPCPTAGPCTPRKDK